MVAALAAVASPSVDLWFSVSGEMGLSNFLNAREWRTVLQETRSQVKQKPWKVRLTCTGSYDAVLCMIMLGCAVVCYSVPWHVCLSHVLLLLSPRCKQQTNKLCPLATIMLCC